MPCPPGEAQPRMILQGALGPPWPDAEPVFRLRTFPEQQFLHHRPVPRHLAAFSRPMTGLSEAEEMTGLEPPTLCAFLNAADRCGCRSTSRTTGTGTARRRKPRRTLIQFLRRAPGLEGQGTPPAREGVHLRDGRGTAADRL